MTAVAAANAAASDAVMAATYTISLNMISVISGSTALAEALAQKDPPPLAAAFDVAGLELDGSWGSGVLVGLGARVEFTGLGGRIFCRFGLPGGGGVTQLNVVQLTTSC